MQQAYLEHSNVTVRDPAKTAALMCRLFDWKIRWSGAAKDSGQTVHVGNAQSYLALYAPPSLTETNRPDHSRLLNLNHLGVVVADLEATEKKVVEAGFKPHNHGSYKPGRRFYFTIDDGLEIEVVSYATTSTSIWPLVSQYK